MKENLGLLASLALVVTALVLGPYRVVDSESTKDGTARFEQRVGESSRCRNAPLECGRQDPTDRERVPCDAYAEPNPRHAVLVTFGQSNSANYGTTRYRPRGAVDNFNLHDGACYRAEDPLLGPDGVGGSVWTRLADRLIDAGAYDRVLIAPFGVGGTEIARWAPDGDLHVRVTASVDGLAALGIAPTHVLWHQGESDAIFETSSEEYVETFRSLVDALRARGVTAPVIPAVTTLCRGERSPAIRAAQRSLPERVEGVLPGPDTDALDAPEHRPDTCHFSDSGLDAHAELWLAAWPTPATPSD